MDPKIPSHWSPDELMNTPLAVALHSISPKELNFPAWHSTSGKPDYTEFRQNSDQSQLDATMVSD